MTVFIVFAGVDEFQGIWGIYGDRANAERRMQEVNVLRRAIGFKEDNYFRIVAFETETPLDGSYGNIGSSY